jgi:acid phosphatase (class A)
MKLSKIFSLIFLCVFINKFAFAEKYFGFESVSPFVIDKPFKMNSNEHQDQISQVLLMQKNVDLIDIDQALEEKQLRPETVVNHVYKKITREKFPNLYTLLDRVGDTSRDVTNGIKDYWKISRPFESDKKIEILISPSKGYCYPSGHTTGGYIYANVMGLLTPQKNQEFQDFAHQIAWHRVQVGMHYPQDLQGGKQLATFLIGGLMQNPQFQQDLQKAREELKKAGIV